MILIMKSNKAKKNIYKKRNFLLIELLIAFLLIAMFSIPLMRNPVLFCKSQLKSLELLEYERVADLTFLQIKCLIYNYDKNNIEVFEVPAKMKNQKTIYELNDFKLDSFNDKIIKRSYKISSNYKEKTDRSGKLHKLLKILVILQPEKFKKDNITFEYKMLISKK
jgi:hypothetical protein